MVFSYLSKLLFKVLKYALSGLDRAGFQSWFFVLKSCPSYLHTAVA